MRYPPIRYVPDPEDEDVLVAELPVALAWAIVVAEPLRISLSKRPSFVNVTLPTR